MKAVKPDGTRLREMKRIGNSISLNSGTGRRKRQSPPKIDFSGLEFERCF
jgi:hypothetical protein